MSSVIPSISNVSLIPGTAFCLKKKNRSIKHGTQQLLHLQKRLLLPLSSSSLRLFPASSKRYVFHPRRRISTTSATGTDVAVIEPQDSPAADENSSNSIEASEKSKRIRTGRKSEMPPIENEALVPGATFTGKVRAIQPFGAFVDFGAFTDGLVHVSQLSDTFVKDVSSVVSIGQEVKVRLVEANLEAGRISLTMREKDDTSKPRSTNKNGPKGAQKREDTKTSKFTKGQMLEGTVKNLTRSGAFISLPDGEEGFLPTSEEADDGLGSMMGNSSLQTGEEVSVRVLRIARGKLTLTMKSEDDGKFDDTLMQGVMHTATNPFVIAFRKNEDIAAFLDRREEEAEKEGTVESPIQSESLEQVDKTATDLSEETHKEEEDNVSVASSEAEPDVPHVLETTDEEESVEKSTPLEEVVAEAEPDVPPVLETTDEEKSVEQSTPLEEVVAEAEAEPDVPPVLETTDEEKSVEKSSPLEEVVAEAEAKASSEESIKTADSDSGFPNETVKGSISPALVKQLREETGAGMMDCKKALSETEGDIVKAQEYLRKKGLASAEKKASRATAEGRIGAYIHDSRIGVLLEVNCETDFVSRGDIFKELVDDLAMQVAACPQVEYLVTEDVPEEIVKKEKEIEMQKEDLLSKPEQIREKIVEGRIKKRLETVALLEQPFIKDDKVIVKDLVKQTIATVGENMKVKRFVRYNLGEGLEKKNEDFAAEVAAQTAAKPNKTTEPDKEQTKAEELSETPERTETVTVSAALVKKLREETGAGMMDCKRALAETGGELENAQEYLRKKGLSTADKKSSRIAAEGRIGSYIHDSRIGVLIEVNCETDFVGRSEKFKELVDDLAMQAVASPQVRFVAMEDIPEEVREKEREIEMQREDIITKPENIKERIVEGRVTKRLGELVLLEQPYIKDDSVLVKDVVKQTVAALGENIKVRRFVKFTLGEDN